MRIEPFSFRSLGSNGAFEPLAKTEDAEQNFTQQDLLSAESSGFVKGYNEGMAAGIAQTDAERREREAAMLATVQVMVRRIEEIAMQHQEFLEQQKKKLGELALAIAKKAAGEALGDQPEKAILPLVSECIEMFVGSSYFVVTLHPNQVEKVKMQLEQQAASRGQKINVEFQGSSALSPSDCKVEWKNGIAVRNQQQLWEEVEALIHTRQAIPAIPAEEALMHSASRLPGHDESQTLA